MLHTLERMSFLQNQFQELYYYWSVVFCKMWFTNGLKRVAGSAVVSDGHEYYFSRKVGDKLYFQRSWSKDYSNMKQRLSLWHFIKWKLEHSCSIAVLWRRFLKKTIVRILQSHMQDILLRNHNLGIHIRNPWDKWKLTLMYHQKNMRLTGYRPPPPVIPMYP